VTRVTTIIGARPQIIKAVMVSKALAEKNIRERVVHTGQHYDYGMSDIFFRELEIPEPAINLGVGSGSHGVQTAETLKRVEKQLASGGTEAVIVYGDTNSTLAGAMAAAKLGIPVFHVEAGLRSFNRSMPEEINRVVVDHVSSLLFAPTETAVSNLEREGITRGVHLTGDVMCDSLYHFSEMSEQKSRVLAEHGLSDRQYQLLTLHRPQNVDHPARLERILDMVVGARIPTVFPVHPRTSRELSKFGHLRQKDILWIPPAGYLDMLMLQKHARRILTDSGGVQKEAYLHRVPCITIRSETEWVETTYEGWNRVVGEDLGRLETLLAEPEAPGDWKPHYGEGNASQRIAEIILNCPGKNSETQ